MPALAPAESWLVADVRGQVLCFGLSLAQVRARVSHGLLPTAALAAEDGDRAWRPVHELLRDETWWVTRPGHPVIGPIDTSKLERGSAAGRVPPDAIVCPVGGTRWRALDEVPELGDALLDVRETQVLSQRRRMRA